MSRHRHRREELETLHQHTIPFTHITWHRAYKSSATIAFLFSLGVVLIEYFFGSGTTKTVVSGPGRMSIYTIVPFIGLLFAIALIPLLNEKWWEKRFYRVAVIVGIPMTVFMFFQDQHWLFHMFLEYASFIALLTALYIISGGITIATNIEYSPYVNLAFLIVGAIIANIIGTTGAAMLLIRPLLKINAGRKHNVHVIIFFIFIVANIGGALTPLGDPPLFLGFLHGVDFFWTLKLFAPWITTLGILLVIFFLFDLYFSKREHICYHSFKYELGFLVKHTDKIVEVHGKINFFFIIGVLGTILIYPKLPGTMSEALKTGIQISLLGFFSFLSLRFTRQELREYNEFSWGPIKEVAILFAAIFIAMIPAIVILQEKGAYIGVTRPIQFFWTTGLLSSFLDNTPTYLTFLSVGESVSENALLLNPNIKSVILNNGEHVLDVILKAISMGAVFMGALTYIGNGPNFMVKSMAERSNYHMPSFFAYMLWSVLILIPVFLLVGYLFT